MYLLRVLIGSLDNLCLLGLAGVITLVLVLRHSFEKRSIRLLYKFRYINKSCSKGAWIYFHVCHVLGPGSLNFGRRWLLTAAEYWRLEGGM